MTAFGGHGGIDEETHTPIEGCVSIRPENHVELARASTACSNAGIGIDALVTLERDGGITTARFVNRRIDVDTGCGVAKALEEDVASTGHVNGRGRIHQTAISSDRARYVNGYAAYFTDTIEINTTCCIAWRTNGQTAHGLAVLVPVEPRAVHVLTKSGCKRLPNHIARGCHFGRLTAKAIAIKTNSHISIGRKTGIGRRTTPLLEISVSEI